MKKIALLILSVICFMNLYAYDNSRETLIIIPKNKSNLDTILIIQDPFEKKSRSDYRKEIMKQYMRENGIRQESGQHYKDNYNYDYDRRYYDNKHYNYDQGYNYKYDYNRKREPEIEIGIRLR